MKKFCPVQSGGGYVLVMTELSDHELLARFTSQKEEKAFRVLVDRHLPAVWEVARSRTGDPEAARDLAQEAFVLLARQAERLRAEVVVSGWLFLTVRNLASKWRRSDVRRHQRELVYAIDTAMESISSPGDPALLRHILVPALDELPAKERDMLLGRYFENRTCREIAALAGSTEEAVRKRTGRALEKLRLILARRGFSTSAAALGGAITTFASTAPPAGLAQAITAASVAAASGTAAITGFSAILAMSETAKALAAAAAVVAVGATAYFAFKSGDKTGTVEARPGVGNVSAASPGGADTAPVPGIPAEGEDATNRSLLGINRNGLDPGELRSAEAMAAYLFKVNDELGKAMPREKIQKLSLEEARKDMKPLRAFLPISPESAEAMERILTARAAKHITDFHWNDHDMVDLLRANKAQFVEAMALKLMSGKPQFKDAGSELDRRSAAWTPGVKEATVKFLKSYATQAKKSRDVMDERDWAEDESTLAGMRGTLPPDQSEAFEQFITERQVIVREGRALKRSQQLAESLQLDASQRQAVFEKLLKDNREDKAGMEALFNEAQRTAYQKN